MRLSVNHSLFLSESCLYVLCSCKQKLNLLTYRVPGQCCGLCWNPAGSPEGRGRTPFSELAIVRPRNTPTLGFHNSFSCLGSFCQCRLLLTCRLTSRRQSGLPHCAGHRHRLMPVSQREYWVLPVAGALIRQCLSRAHCPATCQRLHSQFA